MWSKPTSKSTTTKEPRRSDPFRYQSGVPIAPHKPSSSKGKSFTTSIESYLQTSSESMKSHTSQQEKRLELGKLKLAQEIKQAEERRAAEQRQQAVEWAWKVLANKEIDDEELKKEARATITDYFASSRSS